MAIITFDSAKGGVGKTTLAVNFAAEAAHLGYETIILDCDLNQHATRFGANFCPMNPDLPLEFVGKVTKSNVLDKIKEAAAKADVVVVDLPAGTSELALRAIMKSDLVVIPSQKTEFDLRDAIKTAVHVDQAAELLGRKIYSVLVWSRVQSRFQTNNERAVKESFEAMVQDPENAALMADMREYDAYSAGFLHCWVARQMKDKPGQKVSIEIPNRGEASFIVPRSAAKAAENMEAISRQIIDRVMKIVDGENPGSVSVKPKYASIADDHDSEAA